MNFYRTRRQSHHRNENHYSDSRRENQWLNSEVTTVRSNGVSLDEQAEFNQKRIADLGQECEHSSAQFELEKPSHARNKFALDRLNDAWERALCLILHTPLARRRWCNLRCNLFANANARTGGADQLDFGGLKTMLNLHVETMSSADVERIWDGHSYLQRKPKSPFAPQK